MVVYGEGWGLLCSRRVLELGRVIQGSLRWGSCGNGECFLTIVAMYNISMWVLFRYLYVHLLGT